LPSLARVIRGMLVPTTGTLDGLLGRAPELAVAPDATIPAAILALGLIYLRTNDAATAALLAVPSSRAELLRLRPDVLYMQRLCHGLVLWSSVAPTSDFIATSVPDVLQSAYVVARTYSEGV